MARHWRIVVVVLLLIALCGCQPQVIGTEREYILARMEGDTLAVLADADPLYDQFETDVLSDAYLRLLLMTFEHTTEAFLATNRHSPFPQTLANRPVIVLDSAAPGPLRNVRLRTGRRMVTVELALGLGREGRLDLAFAREEMAGAIAPLLLALAGAKVPRQDVAPELAIETAPEVAFAAGFAAALEALYAQRHPERWAAWKAQAEQDPAARERLQRYEDVPRNAFRFRPGGDAAVLRSAEEAQRTPGVVATFFYRLLLQAEEGYPQRFLLWFVSYAPEEVPYGKVLLAVASLPGGQLSLPAFIASYGENFPAERQDIQKLAAEVFGPSLPGVMPQ